MALTILAASCGRSGSGPREVAPVYAWFAGYDSASVPPESMRPEIDAFMKVMGVEPPYDAALASWAQSPAVKVFSPDVDSVFPSLDFLGQAVGRIYEQAAAEGLPLPDFRFAAVVWGRSESIVFCDSVALVALNHYLGASYPGYSHLEYYRRRAKEPGRLPSDIAEALVATQYPYVAGDDATVLSRILYEGALAEARQRLAGVDAASALGYDNDEYDWLRQHEAALWRSLVAQQLLYSTSPLDIDRLFAPSPRTSVLAAEAPGRAGRYLGHAIVRAYLSAHPDVWLSHLLSPEFYLSPASLRDSRYTGTH